MIYSVVAMDRYNVIVKGMAAEPLTYKKVTGWITIGWIWSFFWAISPFYPGWGREYVIDGLLGSYKNYFQTVCKSNERIF